MEQAKKEEKNRNTNGQRRKISQSLHSIRPMGRRSGDRSWSKPRGLCASQCWLHLGMQGTRGNHGRRWEEHPSVQETRQLR
ncbi:hypothetical protein CORC01_03618 [Colletotrichum orchidophilum]|uniref:Uncharacterized protein n=1 Tax=Colletotrichum orchidophilum TaxID=1209926 RepID=A0A1G4BI26_9PEZI|nr:uncharacterized protein CORC01_03618 [Colletotrichum orchidophilum]OHF01051.1 hypothetical protein CORC01_03618 [Colletotrichum orchidophilum]